MNYGDPKRLVFNGKRSKVYYSRVTDGARRTWKSTRKNTLALAKEVVKTWRFREAKGERAVEDVTLRQLIDRWYEAKQTRVSDSCLAVYTVYRNSWLRLLPVDQKLRTVERQDIDRYFVKRKRKGVSPRTLNNERAQIRSLFAYAVDEGLIGRNPARRVEKFREESREIRTLDPAEEERLLEAARAGGEGHYGTVLCLMRSGLRRGTVAQLEWSDIDFERGAWDVPASKMKSRENFTGRPIDPGLLEWLRDHRRPAGLVFGPLEVERWRATVKAARLDWLRPHDLRRNFVTRCRRAGVPLEVAMYLSDHRDLATVLKCYRNVGSDEAAEAMATLFAAKTKTKAKRRRRKAGA